MKNKYKVSERNGQPAIFTDRGIVCLMEAGYQSTRERDAAEIVTILNAAPDLLAVLKSLVLETSHFMHGNGKNGAIVANELINAIAAISKAEGVK